MATVWPKPHSRPWAILVAAMMTVVNIVVVGLTVRLGAATPWGALAVILQIQTLVAFLALCLGLQEWLEAVSAAFIGINVGLLAVQLVGVRLAFALP